MQGTQRHEDGVHILGLDGEIDLSNSNELRDLLAARVEAQEPRLLLDFTDVTYIDSSGLATLVEYVQKSQKFGGGFALGGVNERLRTVFDLARLGEIFAIHESLAEAKAALLAK